MAAIALARLGREDEGRALAEEQLAAARWFGAASGLGAALRVVAQLAAGGRTNREIAQELFVTPKTVENHLRHAYAKLVVGGRRELVGVVG